MVTSDQNGRSGPDLTLVHSSREPAQTGANSVTVLHAVSGAHDLFGLATVIEGLAEYPGAFRQVVVHTGPKVTGRQAADLIPSIRVPVRERWLGVDVAEPAARLARILTAFPPLLADEGPTVLVVAGEDSTTLACALAAATSGVPVVRLGAGLRSWDWSAPDEIHRVLIDRLADTLLTTASDAVGNLEGEGVPAGRIHQVGNTAVDLIRRGEAAAAGRAVWRPLGLDSHMYLVLVLARPSEFLAGSGGSFAAALAELAVATPIVLSSPDFGWMTDEDARAAFELEALGIPCFAPRDHVDELSLLAGSGGVITDDGDVQEMTSALGINCFTVGSLTERTVTLAYGTNMLLGSAGDLTALRPAGRPGTPCAISLWDGHAGARAAQAIVANHVLQSEALAP